jgi:hypothetical protein
VAFPHFSQKQEEVGHPQEALYFDSGVIEYSHFSFFLGTIVVEPSDFRRQTMTGAKCPRRIDDPLILGAVKILSVEPEETVTRPEIQYKN